jgi:predicted PurR-regulated permease PerM
MQTRIIERYFFFGLLLATLLFTFLIFRPFWIVLVLGISFSIVLYPLFEWLRERKLSSWLASLITVLIFVILLCGPLFGIGVLVFHQSQDLYFSLLDKAHPDSFIESANAAINSLLPEGITFDLRERASDFFSLISQNISKIFSTTLSAIFSFLLMLLSIFYFLKDGAEWRKALVILSPLSDQDDEKIISRLKLSVNGVVGGYLLVALAQGVLMGIGLWLFGVPKPALWGVVASITSLIPMIGTAFISVPVFIYLALIGEVGLAIGFLIWATVIVGMVDNFLSPAFISKRVNIPPLFILFAVLGGLSLLGPVGVLIGPLTASLLYTLISIYRDEFKQSQTL